MVKNQFLNFKASSSKDRHISQLTFSSRKTLLTEHGNRNTELYLFYLSSSSRVYYFVFACVVGKNGFPIICSWKQIFFSWILLTCLFLGVDSRENVVFCVFLAELISQWINNTTMLYHQHGSSIAIVVEIKTIYVKEHWKHEICSIIKYSMVLHKLIFCCHGLYKILNSIFKTQPL